MLSRRLFVQWSAAVGGFLGAGRGTGSESRSPGPSTAPGLDAASLLPLAQAVLPTELGAAGIQRATNAFASWAAGYKEGEETLHPYGNERLGRTAASPVQKWTDQLAALEKAAQDQSKKPFRQLGVAERTAVVRSALATVQVGPRVPNVVGAPHVALALLAHFLDGPDAVNLCYERRIDPKTCRPLRDSSREPAPLVRGRGGRT